MVQQPIDIDLTQPIVINVKKKKKRKYCAAERDAVTGRRMAKISSRINPLRYASFDAYRKASDKSARKKRDGAARPRRNLAKG
jgi:hypothetical protein